jgi:hypothetical protein
VSNSFGESFRQISKNWILIRAIAFPCNRA